MKKLTIIGLIFLSVVVLLGVYLENASAQTWFAAGSKEDDYEMGGDPMAEHGSENAGFIRSKVSKIDGYGVYMATITPGEYLGKGIRMTAYVKTTDVKNWVGLWMGVDGPASPPSLSFDNMQNRPITGPTDWQEYEVVLDVPENCTRIRFGILLDGTGETWVDGLRLESVAQSWADQISGISEFIFSIKAVDENTVWAGADKGIYLRTTDGGLNWTSGTVQGAESVAFFSIAAINQNTAYFLGQNFAGGDGRIYKTSDGGVNWTLQYQNTSPGAFFNSIAFWDQNNGIAVGDPVDGSFLIVTTTDGGENWNQVAAANIPAPLPNEFGGITGEGSTSLAVEGTNNAWFGTGFLTTSASPLRIFRSTDQGQHWTAVNTPLAKTDGFHGIPTVVFKDSLTGFAGSVSYDGSRFPNSGLTNTLIKTSDGGESWELVSSFLPIYPSTLVYVPHTNNSVLFVTSGQGSGYSDDGGATWKIINNNGWYPMSFASPTAGWASAPGRRIVKFVGQLTTEIVEWRQEHQPESFELLQNYPNPFNPGSTISYSIPNSGFVELKIYNMLGREIQTAVSQYQQTGSYKIAFDASGLSNGVYYYQLKVGNHYTETRKMLYIK